MKALLLKEFYMAKSYMRVFVAMVLFFLFASIWANGNDTIGYYEYIGPERKAGVYEQHKDILARWNENMEGLSGMDLDEDGKPKVWKMIWLME